MAELEIIWQGPPPLLAEAHNAAKALRYKHPTMGPGQRLGPASSELIARRLQSPEAIQELFETSLERYDPALLPDMAVAAQVLADAIQQNLRVLIFGDYDVDGTTSAAVLTLFLRACGHEAVSTQLPHRMKDGYGLRAESVDDIAAQADLLVTVDCGATAFEALERAQELGLGVIVCDHHTVAEQVPPAHAVINPKRADNRYPGGEPAAVGVAFNLVVATRRELRQRGAFDGRVEPRLDSLLELVALGTVADMVPLTGANRLYTRMGLERLQCSGLPGLRALARLCKSKRMTERELGFDFGPRINAAGRLSQARLAVELLTTDDTERAVALADYLQQLNKDRQKLERKILKQAKEMVAENPDWESAPALVLASPEWNPGVIGIVASRVAEYFERPAIMISLSRPDEVGQASCRTFAGFDLHAGLTECREHLVSYGGHKYAAGLKIDANKIDEFRIAFCDHVGATHEVTKRDREVTIDAEVRLADLTWKAVKQIDELGPFGAQNPRPKFAASKVEVLGEPRKVGEGERHLQLRLRHYGTTLKAIAFGQAEWAEPILESGGNISICFQPTINRYRGNESVEMLLVDWQPGATVNGSLDAEVAAAS